ncbi:MAG TPA: tetratricopeptide repeat protein [Bacteroidota bacterium]|nr:tetratricopeptide repeat protein [Bacteroidota bacterium]
MIPASSIELQGPAVSGAPESLPPLSLHQLPPPPGDFTGRTKVIETLVENVRFESVDIVGLFGMGGIGKTAIGLKLAEELTPRYPDAQVYVDLRGADTAPLTRVEAMGRVIRSFDPVNPLPTATEEIEAKYRSILNGRQVIIFLDNAASKEQVSALVPPEGSLLILTSRMRITLPGLFGYDVDLLSPGEAREMLLKIAPCLEHRADELARLCGYLPHALRKSANLLLEYRDLSVDDCLSRIAQPHERRSFVEYAIAPAYTRLSAELQRLWRMLSVFQDDFSPADAGAVWGMNQAAAQEFLSILLSSSLLMWNGREPGYRMHELVRLWANSRFSDEERYATQQRLAEYGAAVIARSNELVHQGEDGLKHGLLLFDAERTIIETGWGWASSYAEQDEIPDRLCVRYPVAGRDILDIRQTPAQRIHWLQAPLAASRRTTDRYAEAILLCDAAVAYQRIGEMDHALEYAMQALTLSRETADRRTEGEALRLMGDAYAGKGEIAPAIEYHEKSLAFAREQKDRRAETHALGRLAADHEIAGDHVHAIERGEEARAVSVAIGDKLAEADHLVQLAAYSNKSGDCRRGIELGNQALHIVRSLADRRREGAALSTLGHCYSAQGDARRSIECHEHHLKICRELGDRYGEGNALGMLGNMLARTGDSRRALGCFQELLTVVREIGDRSAEAAVLGKIGKARSRLGETRVAIECHSEQLRIAREIGDRRSEASALWSTSLVLDKLGDRVQAITHAQAARRVFEENGDAESARVTRQLAEWGQVPGA